MNPLTLSLGARLFATEQIDDRTFSGKTYSIQALGDDSYTVLVAGVPVGRVVLSFGAANGVPEGDAISEDDLTAVAEAWFAAVG